MSGNIRMDAARFGTDFPEVFNSSAQDEASESSMVDSNGRGDVFQIKRFEVVEMVSPRPVDEYAGQTVSPPGTIAVARIGTNIPRMEGHFGEYHITHSGDVISRDAHGVPSSMYFGPGHWRSGYSDRREQGGGFRFIGPDVTIADGSEQMELETFYMGSFAAIVNSWRKSRQLTVSRNTRMGRGALIMATGSVPDIIVDARMAVTGDNIGNGGAVQVGARGSTREASYPKEWRLRRQSTVAAED